MALDRQDDQSGEFSPLGAVESGARTLFKDIEKSDRLACLMKQEQPLRNVFCLDMRESAVRLLSETIANRRDVRVRSLRANTSASELQRGRWETQRDMLVEAREALPVVLNGGELPQDLQLLMRRFQAAVAKRILDLTPGSNAEVLQRDPDHLAEQYVQRFVLAPASRKDVQTMLKDLGVKQKARQQALDQIAEGIAEIVRPALAVDPERINSVRSLNLQADCMQGYRLPKQEQLEMLASAAPHGKRWLRNLAAWLWNMLDSMPDMRSGSIASWEVCYKPFTITRKELFESACERANIRLPDPKSLKAAYTTRYPGRNPRPPVLNAQRMGTSDREREVYQDARNRIEELRNYLLTRLDSEQLYILMAQYCQQQGIGLYEALEQLRIPER